jgi:hypothetical protein
MSCDPPPRVVRLDELTGHPVGRGLVRCVELGGLAFDQATFEPGWRWSEQHPGEDWCEERHVGFLIAGRMGFRMRDGSELEARAGDVYLVPPGHDSWTCGDEPCVALDLRVVRGPGL